MELDPPTALDLRAESIGSVVCGAPVRRRLLLPGPALLDADGQPRRQDAAAAAPGVFYLGLQWLIRRACGILHGFSRDAATVADAIRAYLDN